MLGYRDDLERKDRLASEQTPLLHEVLAGAFEPPVEINHRAWLEVPDQKPTQSCVGHAGSGAGEVDYYLQYHDSVELSRWYAYLTAQLKCNTFGSDIGATIFGAVEAFRGETGFCLERSLPFPGRYDPRLPDQAVIEGRKHRLQQHTQLRDVNEIFRYLSSGMGALLIGIPVTDEYLRCTGVLTGMGGDLLGMHALLIAGYTRRRGAGGYPYFDSRGSWGRGHGNNGWIEFEPGLLDALIKDSRSECVGLSGLPPFESPARRHQWMTRGVY